jgi:hypothetical protein
MGSVYPKTPSRTSKTNTNSRISVDYLLVRRHLDTQVVVHLDIFFNHDMCQINNDGNTHSALKLFGTILHTLFQPLRIDASHPALALHPIAHDDSQAFM